MARPRARAEAEFLYLTTRGRRTGRPREVEIWYTAHDGRYYVIAEHREQTRWVQNILADPRVHLRVGPATVPARARLVDPHREHDLWDLVQARSVAKYGWGDGLVVELAPEPPPRRRAPGTMKT